MRVLPKRLLICVLLVGYAASLKVPGSAKDPPPSSSSPPQRRATRALAGLLAGLLASIVLQPLDVVKTRMQSRAHLGRMTLGAATMAIAREEGVRSLWAGTTPSAIRLAGGIALYFVFLGEFETLSRSAFGELNGWHAACRDFLLGALSRGVAGTIFSPITVLKARAEEGAISAGAGLGSQLQTLWRSGDLFVGLVPALLRDVPYSGVSLFLLRFLRERLVGLLGGALPLSLVGVLAGSGAAIGATLLTQPADVLFTQQVLRGLKHDGGAAKGHPAPADGILAAAAELMRSRGLQGLFSGASARLARRVLQQAMTWGVYEQVLGRR